MKVTAKNKDRSLVMKVKASFGESIDENELNRFSRMALRGFLKPNMTKRNVIEYTGPVGISLAERLKKPMSKRDFFFIMEHILVAAQNVQANKLLQSYLRLDLRYVFFNESTKELHFLYAPISGKMGNNTTVADLVETIIYMAKPAAEKDTEYVSRFHYFFNGMKPFNPEKLEAFIQREDRSVVNTIKKNHAGQSGFITSKQRDYYAHYDGRETGRDGDDTALLDDEATGLLEDEEATGLLADDEATGLLSDYYSDGGYNEATGLLQDEESTGLLTDDGYGSGNDYNNANDYYGGSHYYGGDQYYGNDDCNQETGLLTDEGEATGLLIDDEEDGTALLSESAVVYPELYRVQTGECISVNKPVFRLGKERSYVDYFVTNNNAVSRSHADIITRNSGYFVLDLNSKNHTYINGQMLAVQVETQIYDGDTLLLGNEEFVFRQIPQSRTQNGCPSCGRPTQQGAAFCAYCGSRL